MEGLDNFVYHGSPKEFDSEEARPKRSRRSRTNEAGEREIIFDEIAFHATPYRWIALAYTYRPVRHEIDGKIVSSNMGVSLYENNQEVVIYGFNSLAETLEELYGNGGYVYHFDKDKFLYKEGLGNLEVVVNEPTKPITVERVDDPVGEMKELGVAFKFIDLALSENEKYRH